MGYALKIGLLVVSALLVGHHAYANPCPPGHPPTNCAPPPGAILDLSGTPDPHSYQQYFTSFTATKTITTITFAFRDDSTFLGLDDVSVSTGGGPNLVANPGFEAGVVGEHAPVGWTYLNPFLISAAGTVANNSDPGPHSGSNYYIDGAVQAYDQIAQEIPTTPGDPYSISFWLSDNSDLATFSALSNNGIDSGTGGNAIDVLVFADVPEPASLALFGIGLAGLGLIARRKTA